MFLIQLSSSSSAIYKCFNIFNKLIGPAGLLQKRWMAIYIHKFLGWGRGGGMKAPGRAWGGLASKFALRALQTGKAGVTARDESRCYSRPAELRCRHLPAQSVFCSSLNPLFWVFPAVAILPPFLDEKGRSLPSDWLPGLPPSCSDPSDRKASFPDPQQPTSLPKHTA